MTLKGIGEARAEAIIAYRQEYGPFAGLKILWRFPELRKQLSEDKRRHYGVNDRYEVEKWQKC